MSLGLGYENGVLDGSKKLVYVIKSSIHAVHVSH